MRMSLVAIGAAAALILAAPASAAVFTASVPVGPSDYEIVELPQYGGPGTIQKVQLTFSGVSSVWEELHGDPDAPYLAPARAYSWTLQLLGPGVPLPGGGGTDFPVFGSFVINGQLPATWVNDWTVVRSTPALGFSITGLDPNLGAYAGSGVNQFMTHYISQLNDGTSYSGTLTEIITAQVPEPATWVSLLLGSALLGAALRRRSARA